MDFGSKLLWVARDLVEISLSLGDFISLSGTF